MIENIMDDLAEEIGGKNKMKYELIEELIKSLKELDEKEFDTMQDKIESFKDLLEDNLYWADEDIAYFNQEENKPKYDVDAILEEQKIRDLEK